jgi:hypothetical protein
MNSANSGDKIIKNINIPSCRNCIYYKPATYNEFTSTLNRCEKFGEKNIVTDEIKYDFADTCRDNESKCGKEGKYFIEEPNLELKIWKHKILSNALGNTAILFSFSLLFVYIFKQ